jgi:hypothetical protein
MKKKLITAIVAVVAGIILGGFAAITGWHMHMFEYGFTSAIGVILGFAGLSTIGFSIIFAIDTLISKDVINDTIEDTKTKRTRG